MEHFLRSLLDKTLIRLLRFIRSRVTPPEETRDDVYKVVHRRAVQSSVDFVEAHVHEALLFPRRERLWDFLATRSPGDGLHAEFGVHEGWSINYLAQRLRPRGVTIYGFDSFEGLKEDWRGTHFGRGHFDLGGKPPRVEANVALVKGWFDETLPGFLAAHPGRFAFVHFDADTYESTALVLSLIGERIGAGTILLFDEYLGFPDWKNGEFRAWQEFAQARGLKFRYLGFAVTQAALEVL